MTVEQYVALRERSEWREEFDETLAALPAWAIFAVNRGKNKPVQPITKFMPYTLARSKQQRSSATAAIAAPMRIARPGERPPSRRPPGVPDTTIERFDAYTQSLLRSK